jgi:sulfate transport system substrate-binding protein
MTPRDQARAIVLLVGALLACGRDGAPRGDAPGSGSAVTEVELLNVSYDPTREFYEDFNKAFAASWKPRTGQQVTVKQSHGGSGKQARAVIDGLEADVVTLGLAYDVDSIADRAGLLPVDWRQRLPDGSSPYASTIAFLVRKGNPKHITDWDDLVRPGIAVITPNPKTSGSARWNYLGAWGFALQRELGDLSKVHDPTKTDEVHAAETKAQTFVAALYKNVPVLDSGARGATTTFATRGIGDVLINWENEILLASNELGADKFEIVVPPSSILAEPVVSLVDKNADKHATRPVAEAYLNYLYSEQGQEIAVKHYFRPQLASVRSNHEHDFPKTRLFTLDQIVGDWRTTQKRHFDEGGVFDQIYAPH